MRGLLVFDVLPDDRKRCAPGRCSEVALGPQAASPQCLLDGWVVLLADQPGRNTFEAVDQAGNCHLRRVVDQQVHVIFLSVKRVEGRLKIFADRSEDLSQVLQDLLGEHEVPVFRDKDQMYVQVEDAVASCPEVS